MKTNSLRSILLLVFMLALAACGSVTPGGAEPPVGENPPAGESPPQTDPSEPPGTQPSNAELKNVLAQVNEARADGAQCGAETFAPVPALRYSAALSVPSQKHSEDMAAAGEMSHETPAGAVHYAAGSSPWNRLQQEGFGYSAAGENVAWGQRSGDAVMNAWLNSPGHCKNIMNPKFTVVGLGWQDNYWTQMFAKPR